MLRVNLRDTSHQQVDSMSSDPRNRRKSTILAAVAVAGAAGLATQTMFMRELVVAFYGNELTTGFLLGTWLLGTSFGSGVLGRLTAPSKQPVRVLGMLLLSSALLMPVSLLLIRLSPPIFGRTPGEISGLTSMFLAPLFWVFPLCALLGWIFAAGVRAAEATEAPTTAAEGIGWVYVVESVGASFGGIAVSFLLLRWLTTFEIVAVSAFVTALAAAAVFRTAELRRTAPLALLAGLAVAVLLPRLDLPSLELVWRGTDVVATGTSVYGQTVVTRLGESHSFYENGLLLFTYPDRLSAEEAVHLPLLEHPNPRRLLLISGGLGGGIAEALKHPTVERVDYTELDPVLFQLADATLPDTALKALSDPRVHVYHVDGRRFLKRSQARYDVIVINLPDPHNVQVNRFYTEEFFREARAHLRPGGVLAFRVRSSENAINPELAHFLRCLQQTLLRVFPSVVIFPGNTCAYFASPRRGVLTDNPQTLVQRLRERRIQAMYVREYYLPYRLSPERRAYLKAQLNSVGKTRTNKDFFPVAYYFDIVLWSTLFSPKLRSVLVLAQRHGLAILGLIFVVFVLALVVATLRERRHRRPPLRTAVVATILTVGFAEISIEVLAIVAFQALFGYAYYELAVLVTAYMLGLTVGSLLSTRSLQTLRRPVVLATLVQLGILALLATFGVLVLFGSSLPATTPVQALLKLSLPGILFWAGALGGYQFPLANAIYFGKRESAGEVSGLLYGTDLAGSSLGALLTTAFFIPLAGLPWTLAGLVVLNGISLTLLVLALVEEQRASRRKAGSQPCSASLA